MQVFWSYARNDNQKPDERVSHLKAAFATSLSQVIGEKCKVFFDTDSITWGTVWKEEIERRIENCDGLVAIISPSFFKSRACIYELKMAIDRKKKIYPIYFRGHQKLESNFKEDGHDKDTNIQLNKASKALQKLQFMDFRGLRNKPIEEEIVQNFVDNLTEQFE